MPGTKKGRDFILRAANLHPFCGAPMERRYILTA
jgi:hypothetical protein